MFGVLALQTGLITSDQLAEAYSVCSTLTPMALPVILCEKGWLTADDRAHLEHLVERRLIRGDDISASLSQLPSQVRGVLATMADQSAGLLTTEMRKSLAEGAAASEAALTSRPSQRYQLNTLHAAGGIGEIWRARDADLHRDVAVKRLQARSSASDVARLRFLREARITGKLDHPGVVPIYEICLDESAGHPYYAMRFLQGRTLTELVEEYHRKRADGSQEIESLLHLLSAFCIVCNTVAYAHSKGIIHRDLKCENVILGDYGEVVVIDWGLAKEVGGEELPTTGSDIDSSASTSPLATQAGQILGSPAYMAPEQAAGQADRIGPATDVYGLSAILYEILSGQPPFTGGNILDVLERVQFELPRPPSQIVSGIPEALEQVCLKGLAKKPEDRYESAASVAAAAQRWISDLAERRQAEEERERFFALSLDLLAIVDAKGSLRQVSPAWQRLLSFDREKILGMPLSDLIHVDDRESIASRMRKLATTQTAASFEARALHQDGSYRWISWNATPIAAEECVYIVGRDISELKRSQRLFEGVLRSAPDAMVIIEPTGRITMTNQQTERLFGYTNDELIGQSVEMLIPERFRAQHPAHVTGFFAAASVRPMSAGAPLRGRRKDGSEFSANIALSPIDTDTGRLVAASLREVAQQT